MTVPVPQADNPDPGQSTITVSTNSPTSNPNSNPTSDQRFTADDLSRARQQEKDKLYKELEALRAQTEGFPEVKAELEALRKEREERAAADAAARQQAEEEAKAKRESEMTAKELIESRQREYEEQLAALQREREVEKAAMEKERAFSALRDYMQARVAQEGDNIAPELLDLVDGNTPEEVDASIERLKAKSAAIAEKVRASQQQIASQQRGVSPAGFSTTGPMDMLQSTQSFSAEDIKKMPMKDYVEKIRSQVIGGGDRNRGLYG